MRTQQKRKRANYGNKKRQPQGGVVAGTMDRPPRLLGSQQPRQAVMRKANVYRRTITGYYDLLSSAGGVVSFNFCTALPNAASPAYTAVPTVSSLQSTFDMYKITRVGVNYDPIAARSAALAPIYFAYRPMELGTFSPTLAIMLDVPNHGQIDASLASGFAYNVKMPTTVAQTIAGADVLTGGWLDTQFLTNAAVNNGPGIIQIYGTGFPATTLIGRLMITFDIKLKSSA